jgi:hypothetical protein
MDRNDAINESSQSPHALTTVSLLPSPTTYVLAQLLDGVRPSVVDDGAAEEERQVEIGSLLSVSVGHVGRHGGQEGGALREVRLGPEGRDVVGGVLGDDLGGVGLSRGNHTSPRHGVPASLQGVLPAEGEAHDVVGPLDLLGAGPAVVRGPGVDVGVPELLLGGGKGVSVGLGAVSQGRAYAPCSGFSELHTTLPPACPRHFVWGLQTHLANPGLLGEGGAGHDRREGEGEDALDEHLACLRGLGGCGFDALFAVRWWWWEIGVRVRSHSVGRTLGESAGQSR